MKKTLRKSEYTSHSKRELIKTVFCGFRICIENIPGDIRSGISSEGSAWHTAFKFPYGYFDNTKGADGEGIDVYLGKDADAQYAYIIRQRNPVTGMYDEDKVMLGFRSGAEAKTAYLMHYDSPAFFESLEEVSLSELKEYLKKPMMKSTRDEMEMLIKKPFEEQRLHLQRSMRNLRKGIAINETILNDRAEEDYVAHTRRMKQVQAEADEFHKKRMIGEW